MHLCALCGHSFYAHGLMRKSNLFKKHGSVHWLNKRSTCTGQLLKLKKVLNKYNKSLSLHSKKYFLPLVRTSFWKSKKKRDISAESKLCLYWLIDMVSFSIQSLWLCTDEQGRHYKLKLIIITLLIHSCQRHVVLQPSSPSQLPPYVI